MFARSLMGRRREVLVAASAASAVGNDHAFVGLRKIVHQFAALEVVDHGAHWNFEHDVVARLAAAVGAFAVTSALRVVFWIEAEVDEGIVRLARLHDDVAALATIATAGSAARDELLPAEGNATVAAVAGLDADFRFIDKH